MTDQGAKFGRKKEEAIIALLTQRNVEEDARSIGVCSQDPTALDERTRFAESYRVAKRDAYSQPIARLQQATSAAATTLLKMMVDSTTPVSVRVRADDSIFNHAAKAIEIEGVEARLAALEQAASNGRQR